MDANLLEAVEQALMVYCYHARTSDVTIADVSHFVDQVSGAADQDGEDLLNWKRRFLYEKWMMIEF